MSGASHHFHCCNLQQRSGIDDQCAGKDNRGHNQCYAAHRSPAAEPLGRQASRALATVISCQIGQQRRCCGAQQVLARGPLRRRIECRQEFYLASGECSDRQAVAKQQPVTAQCRQSRTGRQNANKVERVRAGQRDPLTGRGFAARTRRANWPAVCIGSIRNSSTDNFSAYVGSPTCGSGTVVGTLGRCVRRSSVPASTRRE